MRERARDDLLTWRFERGDPRVFIGGGITLADLYAVDNHGCGVTLGSGTTTTAPRSSPA